MTTLQRFVPPDETVEWKDRRSRVTPPVLTDPREKDGDTMSPSGDAGEKEDEE